MRDSANGAPGRRGPARRGRASPQSMVESRVAGGAITGVARSLAISIGLLPLVDELFRGTDPSFVSPDWVIGQLRQHLPQPGPRVLDLGCGKGTLAMAMAADFAAHVVGVDAYAPFVDAACSEAERRSLDDRCRFHADDVTAPGVWDRPADAVLMLDVGRIFGDLAASVSVIRRFTRPGGLIVIAERYAALAEADPRHRPTTPADSWIHAQLTAHGDSLVAATEPAPLCNRTTAVRQLALLERNAAALRRRHPVLAHPITAFIRAWEHRLLPDNGASGGFWVLTRAAPEMAGANGS